MKRNKKNIARITVQDYIKAVKKADREIQIETSIGWTSNTKIHKSKKIYNRKINSSKGYLEE